ncbi:MAG: GNAT family N-acetyltransferase [Actinobacteria bacterium]|uniref:Unannotated protein n=1 Tax=freshwater metagenome TaxID=449393 RepID=A0A6J6PRW1_9ZZZZ|nr:GNAT family N-acetyltransferase [Actinomycetota bacterium]
MRLETDRLVLRPWRDEEAPRLLDILSRVEVVRWLDDGPPKLMADLDAARSRIAEWRNAEAPRGRWAIEVAETGAPAGTVLLDHIPQSDALVQIGWYLHPDSHGHGYASEAAAALLAHGLASGLSEIHALTNIDNYPSQAVARRIGMTDLGVTSDWYPEPSQHFLATA